MRPRIREIAAACRVAIAGIPARGSMSAATVAGIALVVFLLLGFLAMVNGFDRSLHSASSPDVAVVTSRGAPNELTSLLSLGDVRTLENAPGIARRGENPLISAELYRVVRAVERSSGEPGALAMRGIDEAGWALRGNATLARGRLFRPGLREIVVGRQAGAKFRDLELGSLVRLGAQDWTVVGLFEASGSAIESEVWADRGTMAALPSAADGVQAVRLRLASPESLSAIRAWLEDFPALRVDVEREDEYYASQSRGLVGIINSIGWPLGLIMAAGALVGALNTMYSSTETRAREIATLRAVGFGRLSTFLGVVAEGVVLGAIGGALGVALGYAILERLSASTLSASMAQTVFELSLAGTDVANALVLALVIGLVGAVLPALRAARQPILTGLAASP